MRAITNPSQVESRSSRRKTRTLRNTFNHQNNNELSEIFSNYFDATARIENDHQLITMHAEEQKTEQKEMNKIIKEEQQKSNQTIQIKKEIAAAKDELIHKLEENNRCVANEVQKIWEKINQMNLAKEPVKKHRKIIEEEQNSQKLQKDLQNAYKWIKIAEKEMKTYRNRQQSSTDFIEKLKKLKQDISEREVMSNRIKNEIVTRNKELKQAQKLISSKAVEKDGASELKVLSEELNYLFELAKQTEKREEQRVNILKKQYVSVKKIERELVEKGMSQFQLQHIKKQCMRQFPTKKELEQRKSQAHSKPQHTSKQEKKKEKVQERNRKNLDQMINQINLLQKKQVQFQKEYEKLKSIKSHYAEMNKNLQQKIRNCQIEYQQLETLNQKLRSKHIQQHRIRKVQHAQKLSNPGSKPILRGSLTKQKHVLVRDKNKRYKSLPSDLESATKQQKEGWTKKGNFLFGEGSQGCNKFNDKYILANENRGKKMVGLVVYFEHQKSFVSGISAIYEQGLKGGDYVWRLSQNQLQYKIQSVQCGQGHIKEIIPTFEKQNDKSRLVGVQLLLSDGNIKKLGKVANQESKLKEKEYISCLYGSMSILTQNDKHTSVIQQLGYQVYQ